jgi:hypothetical protein
MLIRLAIADEALLEQTVQEYADALEAKTMTLKEAEDNVEALIVGMIEIKSDG